MFFQGLPIFFNKGFKKNIFKNKNITLFFQNSFFLSKPIAIFSVTRVQPRTSKGHHRPVIAFHFLILYIYCFFKKQFESFPKKKKFNKKKEIIKKIISFPSN
jgi:hypothetical protein